MKRNLLTRLFAVAVCAVMLAVSLCCVTAFAASGKLLDDGADVFTPEQEADLQKRLDAISSKYKVDIVIITTDDLGGKRIGTYTQERYEYGNYSPSGICFVCSADEKDNGVWVTSCGSGTGILSDDEIMDVFGKMQPYWDRGEYYAAFNEYVTFIENEVKAFFAPGDRMRDEADILTVEQENALRERLDKISEEHGIDVVIITTSTLDGKGIMAYADDRYDYDGGYAEDGICLVRYINGSDKDVWLSTKGKGISVLTDDDIEYVFDRMQPYCVAGNDNAAFGEYISAVESEIIDYEAYPTGWIFIGLMVGLIVAIVVTSKMKKELKTVKPQPFAGNYIRSGSFKMTECRDTFLYNTVSRTRRETSKSSGSSTHTSSSGSSHGGGGRHM